MEEILIPMECIYDIPSLNQMSMPSYKAGDIFMFNPYHEVHVELDEHGVFKEVDNNLCYFTCKYPDININGKLYQVNEEIADKDIEALDDETLKSLLYIGYIDKRLKELKPRIENNIEIDNKPNDIKTDNKSIKTSKAKKPTSETYAIIASKLGFEKDEFKKACFDELGINIRDMRKKCPKSQMNKIITALKNKFTKYGMFHYNIIGTISD